MVIFIDTYKAQNILLAIEKVEGPIAWIVFLEIEFNSRAMTMHRSGVLDSPHVLYLCVLH